MLEIERTAIVIKPTQDMLDWIKKLPEDNSEITLTELREDCTVLLLPIFDDEDDMWDYLETLYQEIFENELAAWTADIELWPADRNSNTFNRWFDIEQHSVVYDLVDSTYTNTVSETDDDVTTYQM